MTTPLRIEFEPNGYVVIEGVRYSEELFLGMGAFPVGKLIRIIRREDGAVTLEQYAPGTSVVA